MKKTLIVLVLIAMAVVPAVALEIKSAGAEAGYPYIAANASVNIKENLDAYILLGYNYKKAFQVSGGVQYKVAELTVGKSVVLPVRVGGRANFLLANEFGFSLEGTAEMSYKFSIGNGKTMTAFTRIGAGFGLGKVKGFVWSGVIGAAYNF